MSNVSDRDELRLQLWFEDIPVADLSRIIAHQGTWFAAYRSVVQPEQGPSQQRLKQFIAFSEE